MTKRLFSVDITVIYGEDRDEDYYNAVVELDQIVIDAVTEEWRSMFYNLHTPKQIAEHIAYNLIVNNARLTQLDGWANLSDDMAVLIKHPLFEEEYDYYTTDYEFEVEEITK